MGVRISAVVLRLGMLAFLIAGSACGPPARAAAIGSGETKPGPAPAGARTTPTPSPSPPSAVSDDVPAPIYGVTVDSTSDLPAIVTALERFSKKMTVRIVFDRGMHPDEYRAAVDQIHKVAYILGQPADSSYVKYYTLDQYKALFTEYLGAFADQIDLWEVGNEVNGNWLGPPADVSAKVSAAYDIAKAAGKKTVLTLVFNEGLDCAVSPQCAAAPQYEMYSWVRKYVPERMKRGVDYVLFSYYPENSPRFKPDWKSEFARIGSVFPDAKLGFGELGTTGTDAQKAALINKFYPMQVDNPRYVKGFFWWYFRQDMVPCTKHLWGVLDRAISK
jgi:hypothetical protein